MPRRTRKQMNKKQKEDKLIDKLKIEFGLKKPSNKNNNKNKKGKGDK